MADEDLEKKVAEKEAEEPSEGSDQAPDKEPSGARELSDKRIVPTDPVEEAELDAALADQNNQLGSVRFVYAAYLAGAVGVGFILSKLGHAAWIKLGAWKPEQIGEPRDEIVYPLAGILGILVALYYWRRKDARQYATEVADELSKVTWPSKREVQNSTFIVVLTTVFATLFFALMDQFWRFVTDKVYGF